MPVFFSWRSLQHGDGSAVGLGKFLVGQLARPAPAAVAGFSPIAPPIARNNETAGKTLISYKERTHKNNKCAEEHG